MSTAKFAIAAIQIVLLVLYVYCGWQIIKRC